MIMNDQSLHREDIGKHIIKIELFTYLLTAFPQIS